MKLEKTRSLSRVSGYCKSIGRTSSRGGRAVVGVPAEVSVRWVPSRAQGLLRSLLLFAVRKHSRRERWTAESRPRWPRMAQRGGQDTGVGRDVYKSNIDSRHFTLRLPSHRRLALGWDSAVYFFSIVLSRRRLIAWMLSSPRRLSERRPPLLAAATGSCAESSASVVVSC